MSEGPADTTDRPANVNFEIKHGLVEQAAINTANALKDAVAAGHAVGHAVVDNPIVHSIVDGTVHTGHAIADSVRHAASSASEKAHAVKEVIVEDAHLVKEKIAEEYIAAKGYIIHDAHHDVKEKTSGEAHVATEDSANDGKTEAMIDNFILLED